MIRPGTGFGNATRSLQLGVKVREFLRNLGVANSLNPRFRQLRGQTRAAIPPLEARPFLSRHDDEGILPVLGDDDRLVPGLVTQCAKGRLKFARADSRWLHPQNLQFNYYSKNRYFTQ